MGFAIGGRHAADLEGMALRSVEVGLGFLRLSFEVRYKMWDANDNLPATMQVTGGEVRVSRPGPRVKGGVSLLGALIATSGGAATQRSDRYDVTWGVALDLPLARVAALERLRAGGDFVLELALSGPTRRGEEQWHGGDNGRIEVSQSDWAKHLRAAGYRDTLLLEIPLSTLPDGDPFEGVAKLLRAAHEHFADGRYRTAVEDCRKVLEALGKVEGDGHGTRADLLGAIQAKQELTKPQRLLGVRYALYNTACLAAHANSDASARTTWDRHDALMVLTMTIAAAQWAIAEADECGGA